MSQKLVKSTNNLSNVLDMSDKKFSDLPKDELELYNLLQENELKLLRIYKFRCPLCAKFYYNWSENKTETRIYKQEDYLVNSIHYRTKCKCKTLQLENFFHLHYLTDLYNILRKYPKDIVELMVTMIDEGYEENLVAEIIAPFSCQSSRRKDRYPKRELPKYHVVKRVIKIKNLGKNFLKELLEKYETTIYPTGRISVPQLKLYHLIKKIFPTAVLEYSIKDEKRRHRHYHIDIAIPEDKIGFEYDGSYWHKEKKLKDKWRTERLSSFGWSIIRFDPCDLEKMEEYTEKAG